VKDDARARTRADKAESVFTWGVFVFVVARAALVWQPLREGSVNPYVFLALDLLTAYPYAKAWPRLFRSIAARRADAVAFWAAVLLGALVAPYLYVFLAGDGVATWVWWVLGAFLVAACTSAAMRLRRGLSYEPRHGAPPRRPA
jgi:hypothetical protein